MQVREAEGKPRYFRLACVLLAAVGVAATRLWNLFHPSYAGWNREQSSPPAKPGRDRSLTAETQATMAAQVAGTSSQHLRRKDEEERLRREDGKE